MSIFKQPSIGSRIIGFKRLALPDNTYTFKIFTVVGYVPMLYENMHTVCPDEGLHLQDEEQVDYYQAGTWVPDQQTWYCQEHPVEYAGRFHIQTKGGTDIWTNALPYIANKEYNWQGLTQAIVFRSPQEIKTLVDGHIHFVDID